MGTIYHLLQYWDRLCLCEYWHSTVKKRLFLWCLRRRSFFHLILSAFHYIYSYSQEHLQLHRCMVHLLIINLVLLEKTMKLSFVCNAFQSIFFMNLSDQRLFSYRHASSPHLESSLSNHCFLLFHFLCLLCQFRLWWYCCYLFCQGEAQTICVWSA